MIFEFQENVKFLSHFKQKFVITRGSRKEAALIKSGKIEAKVSDINIYFLNYLSIALLQDQTQFYHIRANGGLLTTRCIEVDPNPKFLNSEFCYILKVFYYIFNSLKSLFFTRTHYLGIFHRE